MVDTLAPTHFESRRYLQCEMLATKTKKPFGKGLDSHLREEINRSLFPQAPYQKVLGVHVSPLPVSKLLTL